MKIKEILHKDTRIYKILPLWARIVLDHIHELQGQVNMLMANYEATKASVEKNTVHRVLGKYVTPAGRFASYSRAAAGNGISVYMVRKNIKDENNDEYYIDVDTVTIP